MPPGVRLKKSQVSYRAAQVSRWLHQLDVEGILVKVLKDERPRARELLLHCVLKLCIGDLTGHVHGSGLIIQLNLGLKDVRLGPLLPRRLLLGSCCGAIGCGQRVVVAAAGPLARQQVFQPLLSFLKGRMQSDVCSQSQVHVHSSLLDLSIVSGQTGRNRHCCRSGNGIDQCSFDPQLQTMIGSKKLQQHHTP